MSRRHHRIAGALAVAAATAIIEPATAAPPRDRQWYLDKIDIGPAHASTKGRGVLVGTFLSAVNTGHPELGGRVRPVRYLDRFGRAEPWPVESTSGGARDIDTKLAGLVVAQGGTGVLGVAPDAEVQPISSPAWKDVSASLRWLVDQGARVIDMSSVQPSTTDQQSLDGVRYALEKDVVVVIDAAHASRMPAGATIGMLIVAGQKENGERDGPTSGRVTLAAPGQTLGMVGLAGEPGTGGQYPQVSVNGDVQAAALVTGAVALLRSRHPDLNAASVVNQLVRTATDVGSPGEDPVYGHGVLNAGAAVTTDVQVTARSLLGEPLKPGRPLWAFAAAGLVGVALLVTGLLLYRRRRTRARADDSLPETP